MAGFGKLGEDFNRILKAQRGETPLRCAHVSYGTTHHVVSLGESEDFLATAGRCNRRWDGRQLEMTQDTVITDAWVMAAMIRSQSHITVHTCGRNLCVIKESAFAFSLKLIALAFRAQD